MVRHCPYVVLQLYCPWLTTEMQIFEKERVVCIYVTFTSSKSSHSSLHSPQKGKSAIACRSSLILKSNRPNYDDVATGSYQRRSQLKTDTYRARQQQSCIAR